MSECQIVDYYLTNMIVTTELETLIWKDNCSSGKSFLLDFRECNVALCSQGSGLIKVACTRKLKKSEVNNGPFPSTVRLTQLPLQPSWAKPCFSQAESSLVSAKLTSFEGSGLIKAACTRIWRWIMTHSLLQSGWSSSYFSKAQPTLGSVKLTHQTDPSLSSVRLIHFQPREGWPMHLLTSADPYPTSARLTHLILQESWSIYHLSGWPIPYLRPADPFVTDPSNST